MYAIYYYSPRGSRFITKNGMDAQYSLPNLNSDDPEVWLMWTVLKNPTVFYFIHAFKDCCLQKYFYLRRVRLFYDILGMKRKFSQWSGGIDYATMTVLFAIWACNTEDNNLIEVDRPS